jgi:hypothetical protein
MKNTARQNTSESCSRSSHLGLDDRIAAAVDFKRFIITKIPAVARAGTTTRLDHIQTDLKVDWYDKKVLDCIPAGGANERTDWAFLDIGSVVNWRRGQ